MLLFTIASVQAEHVILINIDGMRPDAVDALGPELAPTFYRLRKEGAYTANARTVPHYTITLPNHTSMVTGRSVKGPKGHNWTASLDPKPGVNLHTNKEHDIASMFDVAHDQGKSTEPDNYAIPFYAWGRGVEAGADLYTLNPKSRQDPGTENPEYTKSGQPFRNGDSGNLVLSVLSVLRLPAIPSSTINDAQDLVITSTECNGSSQGKRASAGSHRDSSSSLGRSYFWSSATGWLYHLPSALQTQTMGLGSTRRAMLRRATPIAYPSSGTLGTSGKPSPGATSLAEPAGPDSSYTSFT